MSPECRDPSGIGSNNLFWFRFLGRGRFNFNVNCRVFSIQFLVQRDKTFNHSEILVPNELSIAIYVAWNIHRVSFFWDGSFLRNFQTIISQVFVLFARREKEVV